MCDSMTSALDTCFAFAFDPQVFLATFVSTRQSEKNTRKQKQNEKERILQVYKRRRQK
jgi:hypothetical protein